MSKFQTVLQKIPLPTLAQLHLECNQNMAGTVWYQVLAVDKG